MFIGTERKEIIIRSGYHSRRRPVHLFFVAVDVKTNFARIVCYRQSHMRPLARGELVTAIKTIHDFFVQTLRHFRNHELEFSVYQLQTPSQREVVARPTHKGFCF